MQKRSFWFTILITLLATVTACAPAASPTAAPTLAPTLVVPTRAPTSPPTVVPTTAPTATPGALTITDSAGRKVVLSKAPQRVVSLAPSTTEIMYAIGQGSKLVAVDDLSDFPAEARSLPKVGGFQVNFEQIVALNPDLVLAAGITAPDTLKKLEDLKLTVAVIGLPKTTLEGVIGDIGLVGQLMQSSDRAKSVTDAVQKKVDSVKSKVSAAKSRPKVYWELDATDPGKPYTVGPGNFIADVIALAGGENVFANAGSPFPQVGAEQVLAANPEVIILSDAAYGISPESVKARKGWDVISAVQNNKVFPIDDNLVSRPGPRVAEGIEAALKLIHPELAP